MDFIKIYDNVLTLEQCSYYINLIEKGEQFPGKIASEDITKSYKPTTKISLDVNISRDYPQEIPFLISLTKDLTQKYLKEINSYIPMFSCEGFTGRKYPKNEGRFKCHIDAGNSLTIERTVSVLIYLNTVQGGELYFNLQNKAISPGPGRAVLFPSSWTHPHECFIPINTHRYIIRTFVLGVKK